MLVTMTRAAIDYTKVINPQMNFFNERNKNLHGDGRALENS